MRGDRLHDGNPVFVLGFFFQVFSSWLTNVDEMKDLCCCSIVRLYQHRYEWVGGQHYVQRIFAKSAIFSPQWSNTIFEVP